MFCARVCVCGISFSRCVHIEIANVCSLTCNESIVGWCVRFNDSLSFPFYPLPLSLLSSSCPIDRMYFITQLQQKYARNTEKEWERLRKMRAYNHLELQPGYYENMLHHFSLMEHSHCRCLFRKTRSVYRVCACIMCNFFFVISWFPSPCGPQYSFLSHTHTHQHHVLTPSLFKVYT